MRKIKTINPDFNNEFGEYLEAAGFSEWESKLGLSKLGLNVIYYFRNDLSVTFYNNTVEFAQFHDYEEDQRLSEWRIYNSFTGTDQLDLFKWQLLCHIVGVVTIQQMKNLAQKEEQEQSSIFDACAKLMRDDAAKKQSQSLLDMENLAERILFPNYQKAAQ
jgi:hypothetical protein